MKEGLKILKAEADNFKNISHKVVEFNGKSAMIVGANRKGKSSLIQAIMSPINAKMVPMKPIKDGEEEGSISLKIGGTLHGEEALYNISMYFNEKNQKGRLVITDGDGGSIPGGKSMVNSIMGDIGFDIMQFIDLGLTSEGKVSKKGVRDQIEILKAFMPLEAQKSLLRLDEEKSSVYEERAEINRDIKSNQAKLKDADMSPEEIEKYFSPKDDSDVKKKMSAIGEDISKYDRIEAKCQSKIHEVESINTEIEDLKSKLVSLKESKLKLSEEIQKGAEWLGKNKRPSMELLSRELEDINIHNFKNKQVMERERFATNVRELTIKSEKKTERYNEIDKEKAKIFSNNPLPVNGLSFTEEEIIFNGLPFNENQHPSSTIIGVGIKIAMAMNPNLKVLVIKDGSLMDRKTLNFVLKMVEKEDYQVFIEMVDYEGKKDVTVEFIEGEIK